MAECTEPVLLTLGILPNTEMEPDLAQSDMADPEIGNLRRELAQIRTLEKEAGLGAAVRAAISFLHDEPNSYQGYVMLARLLTKQKRYADAQRAADKARALAPLESEPHIALGFIALRRKNYSDAAVAFAQAIKIDSKSTRGHLGAAAVRLADQNYDEALTFCEKALELDPTMDRAHELMARINMRRGETELALNELKALAERNPKNKRAFQAYVRIMRSEGRTEEALEFLKARANAHPGDRRQLSRLARTAVSAGQPELAVEKYKQLVTGDTARITDRIHYILALTEAGELQEAEAQIGQLGERQVVKPIAAKLRGDVALMGEDAEKALELYKEACAMARIPAPDHAAATEGSVEDLATFWKTHAHKALTAAIRERRARAT